jgi:hypothetical protein
MSFRLCGVRVNVCPGGREEEAGASATTGHLPHTRRRNVVIVMISSVFAFLFLLLSKE